MGVGLEFFMFVKNKDDEPDTDNKIEVDAQGKLAYKPQKPFTLLGKLVNTEAGSVLLNDFNKNNVIPDENVLKGMDEDAVRGSREERVKWDLMGNPKSFR